MFEKLMDAEALQEATDRQIANVEIAIVLSILALGALVVLSAIVLPTLANLTNEESA